MEKNNIPQVPPGMKKILPFWAAAVLFAALGLILLHANSIRLIHYIEYPETNPLVLAETYREEAEKLYKKAAGKFASMKSDPSAHQTMKQLPELAKSRRLFLECLKIKPNMKGIYPFLSDLAAFEGDKASLFFYKGKQAIMEKQWETATLAFDESLKHQPDYQPSLKSKIFALLEAGKLETAEKTMNRLFDSFSSLGKQADAETYYIQSRIASRKKDPEQQKEALAKAVATDPAHAGAAKNLAAILVAKKEFDQAATVLQNALSGASEDAHLLHLLGQILMMKGDYSGARDSLEKALKIEKNSAPLYFDLAKVYEKLGKKSNSTVMLQKAIGIDPRFKNRILFPENEKNTK